MSDEIDLDQSHLCTTEDAFEQFQAVSMYEEDEFITLSDIVPPQPQAPDLSGELNDIPYENEVVLDSNLEEQVPEVNSTIDIIADENLSSEAPQHASENLITPENSQPPTFNDSPPLKRGRKNKIQKVESLLTIEDKSEEHNGTPDISQSSEAVPLTPANLPKRGRRPRNVSQTQDNSVTDDSALDSSEFSVSVSKRTNRTRLPSRMTMHNVNNPQIDNATTKKAPARRGRPRKSLSDQQTVQENSSFEIEQHDTSMKNKTDMSLIEKQVPKKRGRKKKTETENEYKTNLEESKEPDQACDLLVEHHAVVSPIKKIPGKRGRPRKIQNNDKPKNDDKPNTESVGNVPKIDDDDGDDICLSQLKSKDDDPIQNSEDKKDLNLQKDSESNGVHTEDITIEISEEPSSETPEKITLETSEEVSLENTDKMNSSKRNSKQPVMEDFEYNIDSIVSERKEKTEKDQMAGDDGADNKESLLVEDTSKRPVRRKAKQQLQYDEGSDEDPFANVELSDEDDMRGRKGRYYSDDEYIPGTKKKRGNKHVEISGDSDTSDSDIDNVHEEMLLSKRKRSRKSEGSPKKRGRKSKEELAAQQQVVSGRFSPEVSTIKPKDKNLGDDDVEICLETSIIKSTDDSKWGASNEFENFLAKKIQGTDIKIKKASAPVQPLEIPVIDPNEAKKSMEISTQTAEVPTTSTGIQTTAPYDVPMKENVQLTADQSEKACEFLNNIVKTTAELGELMTQKSEDFIKKKINTNHVTDTFKMDYCVRKSFLLFKLAKHNLMQMEEDLAQQYDDFLKTHNLSQYMEKPKVLEAEQKDSDSDCEIIETPAPQKPKKAVPFNPKTVFLNKELSIKIAKKPTDDKKLNIKGRHTVWINDSVMVKKVKPTQSFLAQDSRNKKPPDCVTIEMVSAFFKQYYRKRALATCAPFVSTEWVTKERTYVCNYFFANTEDFPPSAGIPSGSGPCENVEGNISTSDMNDNICNIPVEIEEKKSSPKTLFSLCTQVLQNHLQHTRPCLESKVQCDISPKIGNQNPLTLYRLCIDSINIGILNEEKCVACVNTMTPSPLKTLCHKIIADLFSKNSELEIDSRSVSPLCTYADDFLINSRSDSPMWDYNEEVIKNYLSHNYMKLKPCLTFRENNVKSLLSLCLDLINTRINPDKDNEFIPKLFVSNITCKSDGVNYNAESLKSIAFKCVVNLMFEDEHIFKKYTRTAVKKVKTLADICFEIVTKAYSDTDDQVPQDGLTIDAVNTLTEEAYHNIDQSELTEENAEDYYPDDNSNFYDDETESGVNNEEETSHMEDNWLSQVKMKISSCYDPNISTMSENAIADTLENSINNEPIIARVKLEPVDDVPESVDTSIVKSEPTHLDEMTIIPESIITKSEYLDPPVSSSPPAPIQRQNSSSFDVDQFEAFVSTNKMMCNMNTYDNEEEQIFSQSTARIRRQYEPDSDTENDMNMSLLIPQTYEPMPVHEKDKAKNSLMESSSDENSNNKKVPTRRKPDRRSRARAKKNEPKSANNKEIVKDKPTVSNELAMLTRRMRDKIRQEEKKVVSSDSEHETEKIVTKKGKDKLKGPKTEESTETAKDEVSDKVAKPPDDEIQCSNVDSTEQVNENVPVDPRNLSPSITNFTGFSAGDQNEVASYHKYVKYVYNQIVQDEQAAQGSSKQPLINPEEPVELLECEPAMPFFMVEEAPSSSKTATKKDRSSKKAVSANTITKEKVEKEEKLSVNTDKPEEDKLYVERHGWKCFALDGNDTKLYQNAQILLEKLPESFVETYFKYQDITTRNCEDDEVDKLTNLQTLNRPSVKEGVPEGKCKGKPKCKIQPQVKDAVYSILGLDQNEEGGSRPASPANSEHYDEFTPSEDEGGKVNEKTPPTVAKPPSDNNLAKNSLMDDNDSDNETKVKQEPKDPDAAPSTDADTKPAKKYKPGPKCKKMKEQQPPPPMMLTADKMMNKELNLLHAPVNLEDDAVKTKTPAKGPVTRNKQKSASKTSPKVPVKTEDDSSSEEEKQWFTIKEKLLKRMVKKQDTTREDDAKRAKLVSEFIERRGDGTESYIKKRRGVRGPRSKKRLLERQKQLRVLTRELFGDPSNDASLQRKKQTGAYFKGRRNIRKVIDKKSLAKNTVVANKEEFERKRRINIRQTKLREVLCCEEGVNVLVINDEVCLEYDFELHRPVVTVHPFFTKVMKAHQYEGVKFMWDACFESLESIATGNPGSGCILAHCMGLGKTLQVLALLHTVLTHPGAGMRRVLVCCPLSTVLNWVDEIHKWIGPVTNQIKVFELSKLRKTYERAYQLEDWYNGGGIFIIGYELFRSLTTLDPFLDDVRPTIVNKIRTALLDPGPDIIICDEGHLLKNDCSVLAVAMSRVATARRVVLTGTPMQNNLREYYCMVNFVKPNLLGTYAEFSNRFENPIMNGQHRDSREEDIRLMKARTHILHKVLEGCLQRQEASVLYPYLPKKHEYTVFISLTKCQWDLYKHYLCNYGNTQNNKSILKDFHILQKIWSHPQVLHNFQMRVCDEAKAKTKVKEEKLEDDLAHEDLNETADVKPSDTEVWWLQYLEGGAMLDSLTSSNKFVAVFRILDESVALGDKVLIFSTSLFTMDALEFFLKKINKWSLGQEYYRLDGSVPAEVRQKWCREFNAENNLKTKLFLISTRAGSLGLNMTAANRVIILDTSWNPAHDIQSIFRVYRFGQKKDCFIYRLVALGTMEQKIYERSVTKQAVACRVVDEQQIDRHYNMAELTELYKYDEAGVGVAGGVAVGVEDVVLLRVARDAALHAVHEHDSLLRGSGEQGLPEHERNAAWMQFQQEHAHKQMQEDAIQQQKLKKEEAQTQPPKRPPRKYAKLKLSIKPVKTEESILPETAAPGPAPAKQRGRKMKKANVVSCCIPIQPETEATDPEKEAAMVRKIANILLEYDFQKHKTPAEVSALVSRVREIISSGQMELLDSTDAFTMSIANVFLGKDEPPMPPLTDIAPEEPGPSAVKDEFTEPLKASKQKGRKRGSGKKMYVYEEEPSTSAPPPVNPSVERSRTRRRAAIAAERNFDTITDSVIDIEDEDWRDDSDSTPISTVKRREESQPKDEKQAETRVRKSSTIKLPTKAEVVDTTPKEITESQDDVVKLLDDSILLSDDDEAAPPKRKPGPAGRTLNKVKDCEVVQAPESPPEQDGVGVVPLHPTLLSNKNFIKIVAHTYLSGNPMLDEDAATLAAQYSTFKALKEYQSTRKDVVSGPIYDIAVKVLGIDVLKKLYISNVKIMTSKLIATHPLNSKEAPVSPQVAEAPPQEARGAAPIKIKIRVPPAHRAAPPAPPAPAAAVVPVGLYKRAEEGPNLTADECILPDDDDIHIICDPTPPPPRVPAILGRRKSRANLPVAEEVAPDPRPAAAPSPPRVPLAPAAPIRVHAGPAPPREPIPAGPTESILSDLAAPISLDSDDEDSAAPRPAPPAAPILVVDTGRVVPPPTLVAARRTSRRSAPPPSPAAPPPPAPDVPSVPSVLSAPGVASSRRAGAGSPVVFVVPAGGPGRAPAVPVALSKVQMSPRVSSPHLTRLAPEPGGAQARPSGAPPAAPAPPAAGPQPPPPPQAPPTQVDKNKRLCKPGDILRITASGEIEVLKRRDLPPEMDPPARAAKPPAVDSAASSKTVDRRGAASSSPAATTSARKIYKNNKAPQKTTDHDPLSILKDVIHIEADDYDTSEVKAAPKTAAPVKTPDLKTSAPPAKAPATSKLQEKWLAGQSHNSSKQITDKTVIDKGQDARKTAPDQSKTKERILGSVDLTDLDAPTSSTPVTLIKKSKGLKGATTIVGTSKSIILCAYGKAVSKVNTGAEKRETSGKEPEKAASTTKKVELKKRPAPVETTAAKKKKTDKLRTLRDFDIDAIEGIIELD